MCRMMVLHFVMWVHVSSHVIAVVNKYATNVVSVLNVSEMPEPNSMFPGDYK